MIFMGENNIFITVFKFQVFLEDISKSCGIPDKTLKTVLHLTHISLHPLKLLTLLMSTGVVNILDDMSHTKGTPFVSGMC